MLVSVTRARKKYTCTCIHRERKDEGSFSWKKKKKRELTIRRRTLGESSTKLDELLISELRTLEGWLTTAGSLTLAKRFRHRKLNKRLLPKYQFIVPPWPNGILAVGFEDSSEMSLYCNSLSLCVCNEIYIHINVVIIYILFLSSTVYIWCR